MLASVPWALTSITLAELRVRGSHVGTALVTGVFAAGVLLPALVLVPDDGLDGAVTTWLIGNLARPCWAVSPHGSRRREPVRNRDG